MPVKSTDIVEKKKPGRPKKVVEPQSNGNGKAQAKAPAKAPAKSTGTNAWRTHLTKTFQAGKKKNANYKYSQAMKDAAKTYKKK